MKKLKIILVDDHNIFRKSLKMTINRLFPESKIEEAVNGIDFLEKINNETFDLVLMDIKMPIMDGITATEKAIHLYPDLKILGISMYENEKYSKKMRENGAKGFIKKGGDQKEIFMVIEKIIEGEEYFVKT
jgi:DNA-binding NarL/FixJ family response regulator